MTGDERPEFRIELPPDLAELLATPLSDPAAADGKSYTTGYRFNYLHCIECGSATQERPSVVPGQTVSSCHLSGLCRGHVQFEPWTGRTTGAKVYACCRGVGGRFLREPVWMPPVARG